MVVYIDVVFLLNVLIDGALLWTTAWSRKLTFRWWRLLSAAGIGGGYAVFLFFPPFSSLYTFAIKLVFSVVMLLAAFGYQGLPYVLRNLGVFYLISLVAAGGAVLCTYVLQTSEELRTGILIGRGVQTVSLVVLFVAFPLGLWLYRLVVASLKRRQELNAFIAQVEVHIGEVASRCSGLIDTGNRLYDPLTKTPVMVMEAGQWSEHIPEVWMDKIRSAEVDQLVTSIGQEPFIWEDRLRLVPYRGVNRNTQFMLAIKPDRVVITTEGKKIESLKVLIGLDGGQLSSDNAYQAIIHPSLVDLETG